MSDEPFAGRRILIVEDEMMLLRMMEDLVRDLGCTSVSVAANVGDALSATGTDTIDAATLDISLNGVLSYPVADALAAKNIPFIFVTGFPASSLPSAYLTRPVLRKPFAYRQAAEALQRLVSADR